MEVTVICCLGECNIVVSAGERQIADVDDRLQLCRVCISPEHISLRAFPGQRTRDLDTVRQLIEGEVRKVRVIIENEV